MSRYRSLCTAVIFIGLIIPAQALALEFVTAGPRAMGMGGAGVAVTTDSLATYWNPAGLAMTQTVDIRIQGSGQVIDRLGIADAVHDLEQFDPNDPNAAAKAQDIANRINRPGATVSINGSAGLYIKGHLGEHAFGVNISDVATGGGFVNTPVTVNSGPPVSLTGAMALRALEVRQAAFSYAYAFSDKMFSIGVTGNFFKAPPTVGARRSPEETTFQLRTTLGNPRSRRPSGSTWAPSTAHPHGCASAWWQKTSISRPSMMSAEES